MPEIKLLIKILNGSRTTGSCITYGVQGIEAQYKDLERILAADNFDYQKLDDSEITYDTLAQHGETVTQNVLFKMLGFLKTDSIDYFPNEKPTHVLDLNRPIPQELRNRYDLVVDGGTSEHCFDIKEVLSNSVRLLKSGGRILHMVPISGSINHGFYQFSPILFYEFYSANNFSGCASRILVKEPVGRSYWFDWAPGSFLPIDFHCKHALIFFTATKNSESNEINAPIQGLWMQMFQPGETTAPNPVSHKNPAKDGLRKLFGLCPPALQFGKELLEKYYIANKIRKHWLDD